MSIVYDKMQTYMSGSGAITPPATPTDVFGITGGADRNVYVLRIGIVSIQTTAGVNLWHLEKRSTANTGGTATNPAAVPLQSGNTAADATVIQYSANPTTGTSLGHLACVYLSSPAVALPLEVQYAYDFESEHGQPLALLDATESIYWNFDGAGLPTGMTVLCYVHWCETPKT
jgi:hypothetical protein